MSEYGVVVGYPQRYCYVPGRNPRDCGWRPGLVPPVPENSGCSTAKNAMAVTGTLTTAALLLAAIFKPGLYSRAGKAISKEFGEFLAKHPNLSKGVGGLNDMVKGWAGKIGEKLTAFAGTAAK